MYSIKNINNVDINNIDNVIAGYKPYITYDYYDGLYDECASTIHAIGVSNTNEIILAKDYNELTNKSFGVGNINISYVGYNTVAELVNEIIDFRNKHMVPLPIKIKGYTGRVDDIKEIVIDDELKRFVFVCPEHF